MPKQVENTLRRNIIESSKTLLKTGLVTGTWGNLSVRLNNDQILITPSGRPYDILESEDLSLISLSGTRISGPYNPSSEWPLHVAIYQARPDIKAVVHTHSLFASACAVAHVSIPPIIEDLVQVVGGEIAVADYALPGTEKLAEQAVKHLGTKQAVLLANHGFVGCGSDLAEAIMVCQLGEKAAQILVYAKQLGSIYPLSEEDVSLMHKFYETHYKSRQRGE